MRYSVLRVGIWRVTGRHDGELFGFSPTGRQLDWRNSSVFRMRDGKTVDYTGVWGALDAVQAMGVLPAGARS